MSTSDLINMNVIWEVKLTRFCDELNIGGEPEIRTKDDCQVPGVHISLLDVIHHHQEWKTKLWGRGSRVEL